MKSGNLNFLEPSGPLQACNGTALRIVLLRSKVITINRNVEKYLKPSLTCQKNSNLEVSFYWQFAHQCGGMLCVWKWFISFYKSAESVIRDIIHRFLKAIFLLIVPVHTGNKVILRSQIVVVESPPLEKIDDVNQCESLLLERKFYSGVWVSKIIIVTRPETKAGGRRGVHRMQSYYRHVSSLWSVPFSCCVRQLFSKDLKVG